MNETPDNQAGRPPVTTSVQKPLREQKWVIVMAACLAGAMIGYGFAGFAPKPPDWKRDAAQHHALYRGWTVIPLAPRASTLAADLAKASEAIAVPLPLAVMSSIDTLALKRAAVLGVENSRLAQVLFAAPGGTPLGLYAIKRRAAAKWTPQELAIEATEHDGMASATWSTPDADFLLVGSIELNRIKTFAEQIRAALYREGQ
ncbi:MAG: hypothetical protein ACPGVA_00560 [Pikeienuella sp.]